MRRSPSVSRIAFVSWLLLVGCGDRSERATPRPASRRVASATATPDAAAPSVPLYDANGRLLPGTESFQGLPIPLGFRRTGQVAGMFVYESDRVPLPKLRGFVASRVETGEVEETGPSGSVFRNATVRGAPAGSHRLDVFVARVHGNVSQLRIQDVEPPTFAPGTTSSDREREVRDALQQQHRD